MISKTDRDTLMVEHDFVDRYEGVLENQQPAVDAAGAQQESAGLPTRRSSPVRAVSLSREVTLGKLKARADIEYLLRGNRTLP